MLAANCYGCHGPSGVSAGAAMPSFAGFDRQFLARILQEYRDGQRTPTIMDRIMRGYTSSEIRRIAGFFAAQTWVSAPVAVDTTAAAVGERLHEDGCAECHEQGGRHQDRDTPRLAGQWPDYLMLQLLTYRDRPDAMPQPTKMRDAVVGLTDDELHALSRYYAGQQSLHPASNEIAHE